MKKLSKIAKIYNNKELKEKSIEQQDIVDKICSCTLDCVHEH